VSPQGSEIRPVSVAIPVLNGGSLLDGVLTAVRRQRSARPLELLVCDSGSEDGSVERAWAQGAQVIEIPPGSFSHGGTRNMLMERSSGAHVVFLSQDAEPENEHWLEALLGGFDLADDVALAFGPYRPRPDAPVWVRREMEEWFELLSADGSPRLDRLENGSPIFKPLDLLGPLAFFTDANGAVARWAWERVPFRPVPYAEDHALALDMLAAGLSKAYVPAAGAIHSHAYPPLAHLRRCFDEWRGLREIYGHREPSNPRRILGLVRGGVRRDIARWRRERTGPVPPDVLAGSLAHHALRQLGAIAGSRADRLPARLRRICSLERRDTFCPLEG
jgi:rhamnosyltransferase